MLRSLLANSIVMELIFLILILFLLNTIYKKSPAVNNQQDLKINDNQSFTNLKFKPILTFILPTIKYRFLKLF